MAELADPYQQIVRQQKCSLFGQPLVYTSIDTHEQDSSCNSETIGGLPHLGCAASSDAPVDVDALGHDSAIGSAAAMHAMALTTSTSWHKSLSSTPCRATCTGPRLDSGLLSSSGLPS